MIEYFGPGEHDTGFVGFQVVVTVDGKVHKKMFSTAGAAEQSKENFVVLYRWLEATGQDLEWRIEAREVRYRKLISENHHLVLPGRGLGMRGLTASFVLSGGGEWSPCFLVARGRDVLGRRQGPQRFYFKDVPFSEAWRQAVHRWADEYTVFDEDRDRIAAEPPAPEIFTRLRRQMVKEGRDIPPSATKDVFAEQREQLARARQSPKEFEEQLQREAAEWKGRSENRIDGTR